MPGCSRTGACDLKAAALVLILHLALVHCKGLVSTLPIELLGSTLDPNVTRSAQNTLTCTL